MYSVVVALVQSEIPFVFEGDNKSTKQMNHREGQIFWDGWHNLSLNLEDKVVQTSNALHPSHFIIVLWKIFFFQSV